MPERVHARRIPVDGIPIDRPIVLLDVDGVLNAYDHGLEPSTWQPRVEENPVPYAIDMEDVITLPQKPTNACGHVGKREYRIVWSSELMGDIARAADEGVILPIWLTSWDDEAGMLADELLWPGMASPVLGYVDSKDGSQRTTFASKNRVMQKICDAVARRSNEEGKEPVPVISFDDDMPWDAEIWGHSTELPGFFHGIGTNPVYGITKSQWQMALSMVRGTCETA